MVQSIAYPFPKSEHGSSCGYCSSPGTRAGERSFKVGSLEAIRLSCGVYQRMIDRGWRRSGKYCYKPDLKRSCCPQYTIKLDALTFKAGHSCRKLIHRWNRYVLHGLGEAGAPEDDHIAIRQPKGKQNTVFDTAKSIHEAEYDFLPEGTSARHKFEVTLEPSSYTEEKFALYRKYQADIHHEREKSPSGFKAFLVDSPLQAEPIPYHSTPPPHLPINYGSYHQLYRIDGKLVALAVLDILPSCVSSVYFIYDVEWEHFSLGKLSVVREVTLSREVHNAGVLGVNSLYLGFYIQSCPKMRYKGEYSPSFLADPETYEWYPLQQCVPLLEKNRYACFSDPSHSIEGDWSEDQENEEEAELEMSQLHDVYVIQTDRRGELITVPLPLVRHHTMDSIKHDFGGCITGLGMDLVEEIIWSL